MAALMQQSGARVRDRVRARPVLSLLFLGFLFLEALTIHSRSASPPPALLIPHRPTLPPAAGARAYGVRVALAELTFVMWRACRRPPLDSYGPRDAAVAFDVVPCVPWRSYDCPTSTALALPTNLALGSCGTARGAGDDVSPRVTPLTTAATCAVPSLHDVGGGILPALSFAPTLPTNPLLSRSYRAYTHTSYFPLDIRSRGYVRATIDSLASSLRYSSRYSLAFNHPYRYRSISMLVRPFARPPHMPYDPVPYQYDLSFRLPMTTGLGVF